VINTDKETKRHTRAYP